MKKITLIVAMALGTLVVSAQRNPDMKPRVKETISVTSQNPETGEKTTTVVEGNGTSNRPVEMSKDRPKVIINRNMPPKTDPRQLIGEWYFISFTNMKLEDFKGIKTTPLGLTFGDKGRLNGFAGCNGLMSGYMANVFGEMRIEGFASTRMACPKMELEQEVQKVLPTVTKYEIAPSGALVLYAGEKRVAMLEKKKTLADKTIEGKWELTKMEGIKLSSLKGPDGKKLKTTPWINFDDKGTAGANAGCNTLSFGYDVPVAGTIEFKSGISTMMYCEGVMQLEDAMGKEMPMVNKYEVSAKELKLYKGSELIMTFKKAKADKNKDKGVAKAGLVG